MKKSVRQGGKILKIKVDKYSLTPKWFVGGTKGSYGTEKVEFVFSKEWDGLVKKITFIPYGGKEISVLYTEPIFLPYEIMTYGGTCVFAVSGYKGANRLLSITGEVKVLDTVASPDNSAVVPTPDEMTQVMSIANNALETAQEASSNIKNATDKCDELCKSAEKVIGTAETTVSNTEEKYREILAVKAEVENFSDSTAQNASSVNETKLLVDGVYNDVQTAKGEITEMKTSVEQKASDIEATKSEIDAAKADILDAKNSIDSEVFGFESKMKAIFSNSVVGKIEGRSGYADDVSPLSQRLGISIKGESTQGTVPTSDTPVAVVNVQNPTLIVCGQSVIIPLELGGKDNYRDEVVVDRIANTVKHIQRYYKYTFTGTEQWNIIANGKSVNTTLASYNAQGSAKVLTSNSQLCDVLPNKLMYSSDETGVYATSPSSLTYAQIFARIPTPGATSADFNEVFKSGTYLWYPMAEPIETDYTDTEWGQALLALVSDGETLTFDCDAETTINYSKDINKVIQKLTDAIIALGGTI